MLGVRVVGAVLLLGAGWGLGWFKASAYRGRVRELRAWQQALSQLESLISLGWDPLPQAFRKLERHPRVGRILGQMASEMDGMEATAGEAWTKVLERSRTNLLPEDLEILGGVGPSLGERDREDQARHLRLVCQELNRVQEWAVKDVVEKVPISMYLGLAGACVMILLLW